MSNDTKKELSICCGAKKDTNERFPISSEKGWCSKCGKPFVSSKKECNCVEKSCTNTCTKKHTCHVFWCEKCEPQRCEDMRAIPSKNPMEEKCCGRCEDYDPCYKISCECHQKTSIFHQPQEEDWEKELTYIYFWEDIDGKRKPNKDHTGYSFYEEIKSFINSKVQQARQEERERVTAILNKLIIPGSQDIKLEVSHINNLLNVAIHNINEESINTN